MMISHFKVSTGLVFFLNTVVGSVLGLIRAPILSMIIDNSNSKKASSSPFDLVRRWHGDILRRYTVHTRLAQRNRAFNIHIPAIPIMGVMSSSDVTMSVGVLILFILMQIGVFFNSLLNQKPCRASSKQSLQTPRKRANIVAFKGLICNIPSSVVNILLPIIAGIFFAESGHQLNIDLLPPGLPVLSAIGGIILIIFAYKGTTERVSRQAKQHRARVGFIEGAQTAIAKQIFLDYTRI